MPKSKIGFEHQSPFDSYANVPNGYAGMNWGTIRAAGREWMGNEEWLDSGYDNACHNGWVGFTVDDGDTNATKAEFSTKSADFTLVSGVFAAAWNTGQKVTFSAFRDNVKVGELKVVMDQTAQKIEFGDGFAHVDTIRIKGWGGTDADPDDGVDGLWHGASIAMDGLRIEFDDAARMGHADDNVSAHHFEMMRAYDWLL